MFIQVQEFEEDTADADDHLFYIATDDILSDDGGDTELEEEDFSLDELQQLDSKFVSDPSLTKFPLGCNIWYNARTSSSTRGVSSSSTKNSLKAKSATVTGVYMHLEKLQKVYKLKSNTAATTSSTQYETFLCEDRLVYGMNCPVTVTDSVNSEIVSDGVIVCPRLHGEHKQQQQVSSYDVQILQDNGDITVEFGVSADRIKYRLENITSCAESKFKVEGEKKGSVVVKEVKEEVVETKNVPKCLPVSAKSNDEAELALKPIAQQPDSSTVQQSAETTSSGAVTKAVENNIDPDDYWSW